MLQSEKRKLGSSHQLLYPYHLAQPLAAQCFYFFLICRMGVMVFIAGVL